MIISNVPRAMCLCLNQQKAKKPRTGDRLGESGTSDGATGVVVPGDVHLLQAGDVEKGGPDWSAARSQLPPKWVDVVDKVGQYMEAVLVVLI